MTTYRGLTALRLEKWQDWHSWIEQLKIWCVRKNIWDDVNPQVNEEQIKYQRPVAPCLPRELNAETRADFQIENAVYKNKLRLWKEKTLALKQLNEILRTTIACQFRKHLMGKITERKKLKSLLEEVKSAVSSFKADLKSEYELLKVTPYGVNTSEYFSRWQILSLKCRIKEHSIFEIDEKDPSLALHYALQPIYPVTAILRTNVVSDKVNSGEKIWLLDEIKTWEIFIQSKGIAEFPSRANSGKNTAFSTVSLNRKTIDEKKIFNKIPAKLLSNQKTISV